MESLFMKVLTRIIMEMIRKIRIPVRKRGRRKLGPDLVRIKNKRQLRLREELRSSS